MPEASPAVEGEEGEEGQGEDDAVFAPDYNFEDLDYTIKPDFVDTVSAGMMLLHLCTSGKKYIFRWYSSRAIGCLVLGLRCIRGSFSRRQAYSSFACAAAL